MPPTTRVPLCLFNTHTRAHKRQMSNQSTHINTHASPEIVCGGGNKKDDRSRGESSAHPTQATAESPPPKSLNASGSSQRTQPVLLLLIVWQRNESRRMRNIYPPTHITSHHIHTTLHVVSSPHLPPTQPPNHSSIQLTGIVNYSPPCLFLSPARSISTSYYSSPPPVVAIRSAFWGAYCLSHCLMPPSWSCSGDGRKDVRD